MTTGTHCARQRNSSRETWEAEKCSEVLLKWLVEGTEGLSKQSASNEISACRKREQSTQPAIVLCRTSKMSTSRQPRSAARQPGRGAGSTTPSRPCAEGEQRRLGLGNLPEPTNTGWGVLVVPSHPNSAPWPQVTSCRWSHGLA